MNDGFFGSFNAGEVEYKSQYDLLPAGSYTAVVASGEKKTSQKGSEYLSLCFEVIEGEYTNRKLFNNYNVYHTDPKVKQIAINEMAGLCQAINIMTPQNIEELCNKPLIIEVGTRTDKQTNETRNVIKKYIPAGGVIGNAKPINATNKKPWER